MGHSKKGMNVLTSLLLISNKFNLQLDLSRFDYTKSTKMRQITMATVLTTIVFALQLLILRNLVSFFRDDIFIYFYPAWIFISFFVIQGMLEQLKTAKDIFHSSSLNHRSTTQIDPIGPDGQVDHDSAERIKALFRVSSNPAYYVLVTLPMIVLYFIVYAVYDLAEIYPWRLFSIYFVFTAGVIGAMTVVLAVVWYYIISQLNLKYLDPLKTEQMTSIRQIGNSLVSLALYLTVALAGSVIIQARGVRTDTSSYSGIDWSRFTVIQGLTALVLIIFLFASLLVKFKRFVDYAKSESLNLLGVQIKKLKISLETVISTDPIAMSRFNAYTQLRSEIVNFPLFDKSRWKIVSLLIAFLVLARSIILGLNSIFSIFT